MQRTKSASIDNVAKNLINKNLNNSLNKLNNQFESDSIKNKSKL